MPTVQPDQAVGGLDTMTKLSELFDQQNARQQEIFQAHLNALTSIQQKLTMGSYGPQNFGASTNLAGMVGMVTTETLRAQRQARNGGSDEIPVSMAGQTTLADLAEQAGQGSARTPQAGGTPSAPSTWSPMVGQTTLASLGYGGSQSGYLGYGGGGPGTNGYGGTPPPMMLSGSGGQGGGQGGQGGGGPYGGGWGFGGGGPGSSGSGSSGHGGFAPPVPVSAKSGMVSLASSIPVLGPGIAKAAGVVGDVTGEIRDQRNKDLWYQQYAGNTTFGSQVSSRLGEEFSRFRNPFTLSGEEASQTYKQAAAIGVNSSVPGESYSRDNLVDMAANAKSRTGMNTEEFMSQFDALRRSGNEQGIGSLISQIQQLETVAGKAGVNVRQATIGMEQYTQSLTSQYGSSGGMQMAGALSNMQASWGALGQQFDMSAPMQNQSYQYMMAGMTGQSLSQLNAMASTNPGGYLAQTGQVSKTNIVDYIKGDPQGYQTLQQLIAGRQTDLNAGGQSASQAAADIAQQWWNTAPALDPNAFTSVAETFTGQKFNSNIDATQYVILNYFTSNGSLSQTSVSTRQGQTQMTGSGTVASGANKGKAITSVAGNTAADIYKAATGGATLENNKPGQAYTANYNSTSQALNSYAASGGKVDTDLFRGAEAMTMASKEANPLITVQTKTGPKSLPLLDAINQGFGPQITAGLAVLAEGPAKGKAIGQLGVTQDESAKNKAAAQKSRSNTAVNSVSASDLQAMQGLGGYLGKSATDLSSNLRNNSANATAAATAYREEQSGKALTVHLTPEAKRLLRLMENSGGSIYDAIGKPKPDKASNVRDGAGLPKDPTIITRDY